MSAAPEDEPSMDDILASIRRVLNEDETMANTSQQAFPPASPGAGGADRPNQKGGADDVFLLDQSMMAQPSPEQSAPAPEPAGGGSLVAPTTAAATSSSVGQLVRQLTTERAHASKAGGRTVEELVMDAIRPLLKDWLDKNLLNLVERQVRIELERMVSRAVADN